jgi:hypothetical protein
MFLSIFLAVDLLIWPKAMTTRFAVLRQFDGRWAIVDAKGDTIVFCGSRDEANALLATLRIEFKGRDSKSR